jgi:spore germination protein
MKRERIALILLAGALAMTGLWGYDQYQQKREYNIFLRNQYNRMFYDLIDHVETIEVDLAKSMVTASPKQSLILFSDVWRQSFSAQEKLSQLPISHLALSNTAKFLTQVGDYSYSITKKNIDGIPASSEDWQNLEKLHNYSGYLAVELQKLRRELEDGRLALGQLRSQGRCTLAQVSDNIINAEFSRIEQQMVEYPTLIYDGPFSEHIQDVSPKGLTGETIDYSQAERVARNFLEGVDIRSIEKGSNGNGDIKSYRLKITAKGGDNIYMDISRKGGHVVWMLSQRDVDSVYISPSQALEKAKEFLTRNGYKNMVPTYSMRYDNMTVINFAYMDGKVLVYTDLIKVKVALDNGEIIGFEAAGYLTAHHKRDLPEPKVSVDEARESIGLRMEINTPPQLTLIPLENKSEVLCYEFRGKFQEEDFLVYINALTGKEERILKLIRNENGVLTI